MFRLKKVIALFLCVVMLSSVILTGCDSEDDTSADTTQSTEANQTTENVEATESVEAAESVETTEGEGTTEGEEADDGYTVEEAEWASLFTGTNLTFYYVDSQTNQKHQYDGDKIHYHTVYTGLNYTGDAFLEFVPEGGSKLCYIYGQGAEGNWIKELDQRGQGERMIADLDTYFYSFADKYSSFEYDAQNKQYTAESITVAYKVMDADVVFTDICIKLEDGKIYEITYSVLGAEIKIDNVGTTSVTIPTLTATE